MIRRGSNYAVTIGSNYAVTINKHTLCCIEGRCCTGAQHKTDLVCNSMRRRDLGGHTDASVGHFPEDKEEYVHTQHMPHQVLPSMSLLRQKWTVRAFEHGQIGDAKRRSHLGPDSGWTKGTKTTLAGSRANKPPGRNLAIQNAIHARLRRDSRLHPRKLCHFDLCHCAA